MRSFLLVLLSLGPASALACEGAPASNDEVLQHLEQAQAAFASFDIDAFAQQVAVVEERVTCLEEVVSRPNAAELHRVRALAAFIDERVDDAEAGFASARRLEPDYVFPSDLVPKGNPVLDAYRARAIDTEAIRIDDPSGTLRIDGSRRLEVLPGLPLVVQEVSAAVVTRTSLVENAAAIVVPPFVAVPEVPRRNPVKLPLMIASGACLVAAGGLYGAALVSKNSARTASSVDEIRQRSARARTLTTVSGVVGAVGLGSGSVGLLVNGRF